MSRADDFLSWIDGETPKPPPLHPSDGPLFTILVHMACSDGVIQDEELELMQALMPNKGKGEILEMAAAIAKKSLEPDDLHDELFDDEERLGALRFAVRMAWADRHLDDLERVMLMHLAAGLDLSRDQVEATLADTIGAPDGDVDPTKLAAAISDMEWLDVAPSEAPSSGELAAVLPEGATVIAYLQLDGEDQVALCSEGLAAHFKEGETFVPWSELASYSRVPIFGAAVRLSTAGEGVKTIPDPRLRVIGTLLDKLYGAE